MDLTGVTWRTSTRSGSTVTVSRLPHQAPIVMVRDSKDRQGPVLVVKPLRLVDVHRHHQALTNRISPGALWLPAAGVRVRFPQAR